ncbi:MAG: hypothetical protein B6D46_10985 [Polyangiaceae bacterium UTPRO1]|jgi:hypothetical protein|nr:hypothetical protein [Myxococcales bacterium]OQY66342.1 MAG: hypothetical protein B6D46_10985 [Polyangiaceae bacterium UTPRO1]
MDARRRRSLRANGLALPLLLLLLARSSAAHGRDLVVAATGEAALQQPMIVLDIGERPSGASRPSKNALEDLADDLPVIAILDTGASGHVLSQATAARLGVVAEPGSRYFETALGGTHAMQVSRPLTLAASDFDAADDGRAPNRHRARAAYRLAAQRVLLNDAPADLAALLASPGAMADVAGMPLIRERVVEIVPGGGDEAVAVRLHASAAGLGVDSWIPLALTDFAHRDPRNRGPSPALAENPLVEGVRLTLGARRAEGTWLLDTGAACTIISTRIGRALGLVDAVGAPARRPEFTLPVGGAGGGHAYLPGFRLDRLAVTTADGRALVFEHPAAVVHDVTVTTAAGATLTLDGVLGMNLFLPSGTGLTLLGAAQSLPSPFTRIVIDTRGERLGVKRR